MKRSQCRLLAAYSSHWRHVTQLDAQAHTARTQPAPAHPAPFALTLCVQVTDESGHTMRQSFAVTIRDMNEVPVINGLAHDRIAENSAVDAVVGAILVTDPDTSGQRVTCTVASDGAAFRVNEENVLVVSGALDFEAQVTHQVSRWRNACAQHRTLNHTYITCTPRLSEARRNVCHHPLHQCAPCRSTSCVRTTAPRSCLPGRHSPSP